MWSEVYINSLQVQNLLIIGFYAVTISTITDMGFYAGYWLIKLTCWFWNSIFSLSHPWQHNIRLISRPYVLLFEIHKTPWSGDVFMSYDFGVLICHGCWYVCDYIQINWYDKQAFCSPTDLVSFLFLLLCPHH